MERRNLSRHGRIRTNRLFVRAPLNIADTGRLLDPLAPLPPTPLTDWEILAVASRMVQRADCDQFIVERVTLLALIDDAAGVATWRAISLKVGAIRDAAAVLRQGSPTGANGPRGRTKSDRQILPELPFLR